jgi:hypothetical protein
LLVGLEFLEEPETLAVVAIEHNVTVQHALQDFVRGSHLVDSMTHRTRVIFLDFVILSQHLLLICREADKAWLAGSRCAVGTLEDVW